MARIGQNPAKKAAAGSRPRRITACTIVYIPRQDGFWAASFDVLRASLGSLLQTAGAEVDLFVLDNGSCAPVRTYLEELRGAGQIDCLLSARTNFGKAGAWNVLLPACPGDYVAYFDSDILFRPGWLEESLAIAAEFDRFGMITARPSRTKPELAESLLGASLRYAESEPTVESVRGDLIPADVVGEFARSIGMAADPLYAGKGDDVLLRRNQVAAFAYAAHFQFLTSREVIRRVLPIEAGRALGGVRTFDLRVNQLGLLRLSTTRPLVHHLGNSVSEAEREEVDRILGRAAQLAGRGSAEHSDRGQWNGKGPPGPGFVLKTLARNRQMRRALEKAYLVLHSALH